MSRSFSGVEARGLLRRARTATLATLNRHGGGPYGSVVNVATDSAGLPMIFISRLAWHTQNLTADGRGSLLVSELPGDGDALTGPRLTAMGTFETVDAAELRARYAARHPAARLYLEFADFGFWRLKPEQLHAVAGFGRIETLEPQEVFLAPAACAAITALAAGAADHVNQDHAQAVRLYATRLAGAPDGPWQVTAIDPDGFFIELGGAVRRIAFAAPVFDAESLRQAFAGLSRTLR